MSRSGDGPFAASNSWGIGAWLRASASRNHATVVLLFCRRPRWHQQCPLSRRVLPMILDQRLQVPARGSLSTQNMLREKLRQTLRSQWECRPVDWDLSWLHFGTFAGQSHADAAPSLPSISPPAWSHRFNCLAHKKHSDESIDKCVQMHDKCVQMHDKCHHMHDKCVQRHDKCVQMHDKCVQMHDKCVQMHAKCVQMHEKCVQMHDQCVQRHEKCV